MGRKDEKTKEGKSFCSFGKLKEIKMVRNDEISRKIFIYNGLFCFFSNLVSFGEKPQLFLFFCITFLQSERAYYFLMGPNCNFMCWACWGWENIFQGDFFSEFGDILGVGLVLKTDVLYINHRVPLNHWLNHTFMLMFLAYDSRES